MILDDLDRLAAWQIVGVLFCMTGLAFVLGHALVRWATRPRRRSTDRWWS